MKKLNITKEQYSGSEYQKKYGSLKFVSESSRGNLYKTDKGRILKFVAETREYVDDNSIEADSAEEFIIFDDPDILNKIANVQKQEEKKVEDEIKEEDVTKQDVAQAAQQGGIGVGSQIASSAISGATNIVTNPTVISLAAAAYGAKEVSDTISKTVKDYKDTLAYLGKVDMLKRGVDAYNDRVFQGTGIDPMLMNKGQQYLNSLSDSQYKALGFAKWDNDSTPTDMEFYRKVAQGLPEKDRAAYLANAEKVCDKLASGAAGAGAASGAGTTIFGMSLATIGWIAAGVAAAAVITPYIYDKVRACTKTWLADIIAEVKFKADGKNYRCFYDLKDNKWVLTYADIKWSSYLDNKLDKETIDEFFASNFFKQFLDKCRKAFAMLFSTSRNEIVFKTLPEIKDAPKELKKILEKIYDNKGAITKNLFTGNHD